MALNKKILDKIAEKTKSDELIRKDLKCLLSGIEEGRQGKRIIERLIRSI